MAGLGFNKSDSSSTGRQQSATQFPKQFLLDLHKTIGGPFTTNDLFRLMPKPSSLFGYGPTEAVEPSGKFNLGFGPPPPGGLGSDMPAPGSTPLPDETPAPGSTPGLGQQPPAAPRLYRMSDLEDQFASDPEKLMDLPRLFKQAGLDPEAFTYDEFEKATRKAKKYGFSGRSQGNFARALSGLQRDAELEEEFAGGKGAGVF